MTTPQTPSPLPWRQVYILLLMRLADPLAFTILFPFVYFMVKDFHITQKDSEIGFYVGMIASSFAFSQTLSVIPWGILSDKIGRRPVILFGLMGTTMGMFMFGLSKSLAWAITARITGGILSGNVGVIKTVMGEITNDSNRAQAFSLMPMMYGIGCIIGPTIGGFLSNPMDKFPWLFGDEIVGNFLKTYPYFLPCGICSAFIFTGFVLGVFFLEETVEQRPKRSEESPLITDNDMGIKIGTSSQIRYDGQASSSNQPEVASSTSSYRNPLSNVSQFFTSVPKASWITILSYSLQALISVTYSELLPLWSATPVSLGGLGFTSSDIGSVMAFGGIALLFIQILIYPRVHRRFGTILLFQRAYLCYIFVALLFPSSALVESSLLFKVFLLSLVTAHTACNVFSLTSINILIVETCPDKKILGKINGIALAASSLVRAIGPSLCGTLFSWSLSNNFSSPLLHAPFTWIALANFSFISYLFALRLSANRGDH